jgi:hypothetical protein
VTGAIRARLRHPPTWMVDEPAWPDTPMPIPSVRYWRDVPHRFMQRAAAWLTHRNPAAPPWRRRAGHAWQVTVSPADGGTARAHAGRPLFGVIAAWNEEDVIWSTVTNLFREGCAEVFVLDDGSTDGTIAEASAAGAEVVPREPTTHWLEAERCAAIDRLIAERTRDRGQEVWWLVADADEFPTYPGSIRGLLDRLPENVDAVGSEVVEHYPAPDGGWTPRCDPLGIAGLACPYPSDYCPLGHWKHQLFLRRRYDDPVPMPGAHTLRSACGRRIREWCEPIAMHHFPYRDLDRLERRITGVRDGTGRYGTTPDTFTAWRARHRLEVVRQLRARRYDRLSNSFPGQRHERLELSVWCGRDDTAGRAR